MLAPQRADQGQLGYTLVWTGSPLEMCKVSNRPVNCQAGTDSDTYQRSQRRPQMQKASSGEDTRCGYRGESPEGVDDRRW